MSVAGNKKRKTPLRHAIEWVITLALGAGVIYAVTATGIRVSPVMSDSMSPQLEVGDAVLYVPTKTQTPHVGDVIVFTAHLDATHTLPIVHRWVDTTAEGKVVTKGDNNERRDPWNTTMADIQGVEILTIPTHYLRQSWVIPVAATVLLFVIIASFALAFIKKDDEEENLVADDDQPTPEPPADTPTVRVIPPIPADNTFHDLIAEATRPQPVIPDGWTPAATVLPADPADIYLAPQPALPPRPHRDTPHGDTGNPQTSDEPEA